MNTVTEVMGTRCLNQHHFADAEAILHRPVHDSYTMHVRRDGDVVTMFCPWCMYKAEHNIANGNPVQVKVFSGKTFTFD